MILFSTIKNYVLLLFLAVLMVGAGPLAEAPEASITNGIITAKLYLPHSEKGYYRASRFDWSGVISSLEYNGHSYFGQWFNHYNPMLHDAITGPVDDFLPVGYYDAKAGETFLKIGIGMVAKPEELKYSIVTPYKLINGGNWKVKTKNDRVYFEHTLTDKDYAYQYKKEVTLVKDKPRLELSHSLTNRGKKSIETDVYNHNFYVIDGQPSGPDFSVKFPFELKGETNRIKDILALQGNEIKILRNLENREQAQFRALEGFSNSASDYDIKIENSKTRAGVRITSDRPMSKLVFWCAPKTLCPEPFTHIKLEPGETFTWKITYDYYTL